MSRIIVPMTYLYKNRTDLKFYTCYLPLYVKYGDSSVES